MTTQPDQAEPNMKTQLWSSDFNIKVKPIEHVEGPGEACVCPVCSHALTYEHGEAVCRSGMCHRRPVEDCC